VKFRVRLPGDIIFRLRLQDYINQAWWKPSRRNGNCTDQLPWNLPVAAGLTGLSTPWMAPSLSMVVQICSPLGSLHHSGWSYRYNPDAPCFVGYPGYWLLLGKPDEYHAAHTSSARIQDVDVILIWRLYLPGIEPGISRSLVGITTVTPWRLSSSLMKAFTAFRLRLHHAGLIQFVYTSHLCLATGVTLSRILFPPFFRANSRLELHSNCKVNSTSQSCIDCLDLSQASPPASA